MIFVELRLDPEMFGLFSVIFAGLGELSFVLFGLKSEGCELLILFISISFFTS